MLCIFSLDGIRLEVGHIRLLGEDGCVVDLMLGLLVIMLHDGWCLPHSERRG